MELQMWREILCPYDLAVEELKLKFVHIMNEYRTAGRYSPIEQVDGRVKSISSILDKMQRKRSISMKSRPIWRILRASESFVSLWKISTVLWRLLNSGLTWRSRQKMII